MKKIILLLFALSLIYANFFSEKARLDREVDRLCAIDGGIRVYETVKLPSDKFNERGEIAFYRPTQKESALGPEYVLDGMFTTTKKMTLLDKISMKAQ